MAYTPISYSHIKDDFLREEVFRRTNMFLSDVHTMLWTNPPPNAGGCGWASVLVLLCVIDGMATYVYPTEAGVRKQEKRFTRLIREKLYWGNNALWFDKANAASLLYKEVRNPLVHEVALDNPAKARPRGYGETAIGKWAGIPEQDIACIEGMVTWNDNWPILGPEKFNGGQRLKLGAVALYWATRRLVTELANDQAILDAAVNARSAHPHSGLWERLCKVLCRN